LVNYISYPNGQHTYYDYLTEANGRFLGEIRNDNLYRVKTVSQTGTCQRPTVTSTPPRTTARPEPSPASDQLYPHSQSRAELRESRFPQISPITRIGRDFLILEREID
jgi:hypothetical protein